MIEYKYKKRENKFTENGHTMFEEDVLQRLKRLAYLEEQIKQGQLLPIDNVSECVLYSDGTNMQYKGDADLSIVLDGEFKGISLKQLGKGKITINTPSDR